MVTKHEMTKEQRVEYWTKILLERVREHNQKEHGDSKYPMSFDVPLVKLSEILEVKID